jgi:hypothetical protein
VLELGDAERQIVVLLALHDAEPPERLVERLGAARPHPLDVAAPAGQRVADGVAHLVALDAHPSREIVGELVRRLGSERCPADPGEQELPERAPPLTLGPLLVRGHC